MIVKINDKEYRVKIAYTDEEKSRGLQGINSLPEDEGIVFIDDDEEVLSVYSGEPNDRTIAEEDNVKYVLEVNQGSGIKEGDEIDIEEEEDDSETSKMLVIGPDGGVQMELEGGERIVSRRETKILVKKAKKAYNSELDSDYKSLGKYMFKVLNKQDKREPEYVEQE